MLQPNKITVKILVSSHSVKVLFTFFLLKKLIKVHFVYIVHPRIRCSSHICSSPISPQKVFNWLIVVICQIKNCKFVNLALRERNICHKMIKYWHVYTCCQERNSYVAVWPTCILMYWMKLLLYSFSFILFSPVHPLYAYKWLLLLHLEEYDLFLQMYLKSDVLQEFSIWSNWITHWSTSLALNTNEETKFIYFETFNNLFL